MGCASESFEGMILLPGGDFLMGTNDGEGFPEDGEGPVRSVRVSPFFIDEATVTNARFARFADATGYITDAELFGWSFVFWMFLPADFPPTRAVASAPWWRQVEGACWRRPEGDGSSIAARLDHPVVHVSWNDAASFAAWAGKRLPTEAEWEYAARGGLTQQRFPWGDELTPGGVHRCNTWQGDFPTENTAEDGWVGTAPSRSFPPNGYGLFNMSGNVWEWCADLVRGGKRATRGGSYLCHESYCNRYRVAARGANGVDDSTGNLGLRCVRDA